VAFNRNLPKGGSAGPFGGPGADGSANACGAGGGGAGLGGAIFNDGGTVTITNSTLSGNTAQGGLAGTGETGAAKGQGLGGAIFNHNGSLTLTNSTLSGNTAQAGRGVYNVGDGSGQTATAVINNTIIGQADTTVSDFVGRTINGGTSTTSGSGNLIRSQSGFSGTIVSTADPLLQTSLTDNGGPTLTLRPQSGSPAIGAGNVAAAAGLLTDQRLFGPRVFNGMVDIGAVESADKRTPILTWANPVAIVYGTALSASQLDAMANVSGSFAYSPAANTVLGVGSHTLSVTFTPTETADYNTATANVQLMVTPATLTITPNMGQSKSYGAAVPALTYTATGLVNNDPLSTITGALATTATVASSVGSYPFTLGTLAAGSNYTVVLAANPPTFAVTPATLKVTATNFTRQYGQANPTFTYAITGFVNGDPATVVSGTPNLSTSATASSAPSSYTINVDVSPLSAANYIFQPVNGTLTVTPATLTTTDANFNATAGAPFSIALATFSNVSPNTTPYTALIDWGDGSTSTCSIRVGSNPLTITGSHTYADPKSYTVSVQISNPNTTTAKFTDIATVTSLGQSVGKGLAVGIGFWHNQNGQALLNSFNGGATATALSAWLAATFPNLYGASAGANNLTGKTNAQVAAFYLSQFNLSGPKVQAQVLATALNVYATTQGLGGTAGVAYGFSVSATGLGARSYNVGSDGAAFGVANNTTCNVYELLLAVNKQAVNGVLYNGNATLQAQAADLFNNLNGAGGIS
jgi:hypothetical protein